MNDWKKIAKEQMKLLGISQYALAEKLNCSQGAIAHWLNGRRKADLETINSILRAIKLPSLEIGSQTSTIDIENKIPVSVWDDTTSLDDDEVEIPLIKEIALSAGNGYIVSSEYDTGKKLRFDKKVLIKQGVDFNHAICVPVKGNSMEPFIQDGAIVGIDTSKTEIIDGKIYAVVIDKDLARVKQLYRLPNNKVRLRSFNRDEYEDEKYSLEDVRVIGKVFWSSVLWD